ncbi:calcineurin-binding protein cabin-1-like [Rhopilema esculentum]|uniref:calcineurin-binding protein cabin-1-like n=1 Tax=Rhopilema esculentum TaxID=499914 RepID=UPI0031E01480
MLGFGALNNDSEEYVEREPPIEIIQEAQESEALAIYHKALACQKSGDNQEAERLYLDVLKTELLSKVPCPSELKPEEIQENSGLLLKYTVYKNLGDISYAEEDNEKALDNYLEAALIDESDVSLWWRIGDIALKVTNMKLARYSFEKGLIVNSKHWPCLDNLVTVLFAIGDYAACLEAIVRGLEMDSMFVKGLVIRDQIFKEEAHFRREYREFHILFENENQDEYYDDSCVKYIEEALVLREKRCLLAKKEDLQKIKLTKQLTFFTWACVGDCLIHQYDELTNPDNPKSLCRPLDIEKYSKTPEQQNSLAIPSPETNWKGAKPFGKDEERKGIKRKKIQSALFEKDVEPVAKRRSARVKSSKKEEDVNWSELLQNFLPEFLRSDSVTENEDSQDSMAEDYNTLPPNSTATDLNQKSTEEAKLVSDFINKNVRNSGCIDLMCKFVDAVASHHEAHQKWYHGLPQIYTQVFKRIRKHIQYPELPPRDGSEEYTCLFAKSVLYVLEFQLDEWLSVKSKVPVNFSPGKQSSKAKKSETKSGSEKPNGCEEFQSDLSYLMFLVPLENVFKEFWLELITRLHWLEARFLMLIGDTKQSIRVFNKCIDVLTPGNGMTTDPKLLFRLENCTCDAQISLETVQRKFETLQRCLSLQEVSKSYEDEKYADVVELLLPLLKQRQPSTKDSETTSAPAERPTQLLLLQDSLAKLGQIKKCIMCSELAINEAVQQMTPTEDWKILINGFLECLNRVLNEDVFTDKMLPSSVLYGLVHGMIRIIETSMECLDSNEIVLATTIPWLILYKIVKSFNPSSVAKEDCVSSLREMLAADDSTMPPSFMFIKSAHDVLGRRGLCCADDGLLLLAFSKDLKSLSDFLMPQSKKEDVLRELEQCFYCLYGHPSKKTKSRKLHDHVTSQIPLIWEHAHIVYEHFRPPGLPTLDNKLNTISMEVQLLLRRIISVVPQKEVEVISFDELQSHIDGLADFPVEEKNSDANSRVRIQDLFYYLADYYFKNKEFNKAIKFYMHDVCLNPKRFESWAAMALARGSRLEEKISAHEPKSDGPIRKNIVSTLRCFEKAVELNNKNCMILEEYGSTSYMLNSQAARRLRELIQDEEYTKDVAVTLMERRNEMLKLSEKCFSQAKSLVKRAEGEPWLHSYMLGKTSERLEKSLRIYLDYYMLAGRQLYIANANYPKRIPYHNPPEYSIESLEMYYRTHASILKFLRKCKDNLDFALIEEYLDKAEESPFVKGINIKSVDKPLGKEDSFTDSAKPVSLGDMSEKSSSVMESQVSIKGDDVIKTMPDNQSLLDVPSYEDSPSLFSETYSQNTSASDSQMSLVSNQTGAPESTKQHYGTTAEYSLNVNSLSQMEGDPARKIEETPKNKSPNESGLDQAPSDETDSQFKVPESKPVSDPPDSLPPSNEQSFSGAAKEDEKIPSLAVSMIRYKFSSEEERERYKKIIDRCVDAFSLCLKRFPEHYKSQHKIAFVMTYFETHKDLSFSRELLLGSSGVTTKRAFVPQHGIFTDRSKTNLFQYIWRIPIDEVDRRGSFCSHICKAVELLLHVLSELKEWDTLLTVSGLLHLTPSKDKKYLRDNDRLLLALKAFDIANDILKERIKLADTLSRTEKKLLLLDCYEAYRHAQKMQTSMQITEHFLTKLYRLLLYEPDENSEVLSPLPDKVVLEQALRFCVLNAESAKKFSVSTGTAPFSSPSSQNTVNQVTSKNPEETKSNDVTNSEDQKQAAEN